ncbi:hypothetical protein SODALDRAFT_334707 [Sodiomyces alkalinus F11]|uniref:2EXR domain-containing protein n=1 Tax=Sodiomyces alkalinus (strain CBS 110278 / VKM F-3762 / F11) TaxID=1314773 RepID=A0A3N2PSW4_SODAK|nr:hypothetical protein SODALDRAFT_334707 [Sodiomyces alkalinus F11]ROT37597.1 hypothetical protein SODALDRAFT_334707 [Sodiomyces alkalinus F11]
MEPRTLSFAFNRLPPELRLQIWEEAWLSHDQGIGRVVDMVSVPRVHTIGRVTAAASSPSRLALTLPRFALASKEAIYAVLQAHPNFCTHQPHTRANFSIDTLRWRESSPETTSAIGFCHHGCRGRRRVERIVLQSSTQGFIRPDAKPPRDTSGPSTTADPLKPFPLGRLDAPRLRHVWFEYLLNSQDASPFDAQNACSRHVRFQNQIPLHCYLFRYFTSSGRVQVARLDASPATAVSQVDGPLSKQLPAGSMLAYERQIFWASASMHNRRALYARVCIVPGGNGAGGHADGCKEDHEDRRVDPQVSDADRAVSYEQDLAKKDDEGPASLGRDQDSDVGEWDDVSPWSEEETDDLAHCRTIWQILMGQVEARLLDSHQ